MKEKIMNFFTKENFKNMFSKEGMKKFFFSFVWLAILLFVIDIVSKQIVKNNMTVGQEIWLIPSFLEIHYVQNVGMAFGVNFNDHLTNSIVFILVSVIGFILLTFVYIKYFKKFGLVAKAALMLMISGCFGNLIDRAFYTTSTGEHFVVDFIGFFGTNGFPRFNVADSCLVIGCFMLAIYFIIDEIKNDARLKKVQVEEKKEENTNENE